MYFSVVLNFLYLKLASQNNLLRTMTKINFVHCVNVQKKKVKVLKSLKDKPTVLKMQVVIEIKIYIIIN